jgi:hypothetical protein
MLILFNAPALKASPSPDEIRSADFLSAGLDPGFRCLYDLDFTGAQKDFESWEELHPGNPMGPASEAAGILFSEFNRLGVLESQFYQDDSAFRARKKYEADPQQRARFEQQVTRAEDMAEARLSRDSKDRDGLLAMTLAAGLRSDFMALIEKRNITALHYTKEATSWSTQLLAVDPSCFDAHLAGGVSRYIIGSMALPMRWFARLGGVSGDKEGGIAELQTVSGAGPPARSLRAYPSRHSLRPRKGVAAGARTVGRSAKRVPQQLSFWPRTGAAGQGRRPLDSPAHGFVPIRG